MSWMGTLRMISSPPLQASLDIVRRQAEHSIVLRSQVSLKLVACLHCL